nr:amiloride-sensitive sodium channel subunit alpha-like [Lytechinus pictus]
MGSKSKENLFPMEGLEAQDIIVDDKRCKKSKDKEVRPNNGDHREGHAPYRSVRTLLKYFVNTTTFHGLPQIFGAPYFLERVFWLAAFLTCLGVFTHQGTVIVYDFISYPYSTRTDIITESSLDFPAVTICNANMMRRSKLVDTRFEDLVELDGDTGETDDYSFWFDDSFFNGLEESSSSSMSNQSESSSSISDTGASQAESTDLEDIFSFFESDWDDSSFDFSFYDAWNGISGANNWRAIFNQSQLPNFSDVRALLNPTRAELEEYGHQAEDFILQCSFDQRPCSYRNFSRFEHSQYGNCFTFNGKMLEDSTKTTLRSGRTGSNYGLQLTLFTEQPENIGILTDESGVKVSIHGQTEQPFPETNGLTASTGQKTIIGLRKLNITRLGGRYGEPCTRAGEGTNFTSQTFSYTVNTCQKQCLQATLRQSCGCITDIRFSNYTQCSALDSKQEKCRQLVEYLYDTSTLKCSCPIPCSEESYRRTVSSSLWPSTRYEEHLAEQLVNINNKLERILTDSRKTRENVVNLVVFFEELNYELNLQLPVYTLESLLGNLGGLLGLYLGISFMSMGEILFLFAGFLNIIGKNFLCRSCRSKKESEQAYDDRDSNSQFNKSSPDYDEEVPRAQWYRNLVVLGTLFVFSSMVVVVTLVVLFDIGLIKVNL